MEFSHQPSDPIRGSVLRLLDLGERLLGLRELPGRQMPPSDVDLDGETEQELREVVVEERGDLLPFVLSLLGHPVRERSQHLLAILELGVRLLERLRAEEHLPSQQQGDQDHRDGKKVDFEEDSCQHKTKDCQTEIAHHELRGAADHKSANHAEWTHSIVQTGDNRCDSKIDDVIRYGCEESCCEEQRS